MECKRCGNPVPPPAPNGGIRIWCSRRCQRNAAQAAYMARKLPPIEPRRCAWCRAPLEGRRRQTIYCSDSCKTLAYRARRDGNPQYRRKRCARCRKILPPSNATRFFCTRSCRLAVEKGLSPYQIHPTDFTRSADLGWVFDPVRGRGVHAPSIVHSCPLCVRRGRGRGAPRREEDGVWVCDAVYHQGRRPCLWVWSGWVDLHNVPLDN